MMRKTFNARNWTECLKDSDLKMQALYDQVDQLSKENVENENECQKLKEFLRDSVKISQTLQDQVDQLSKENVKSENDCQKLKEFLKDSEKISHTLQDQIDQLSKENDNNKKECQKLKEYLENSEIKVQALRDQIDQLTEEKDEKENEFKKLTEFVKDSERKLQILQDKVNQQSDENDEKQNKCQKLNESLKDSELKMKTMSDQIFQLSEENGMKDNERQRLNECLKDSEMKIQTLHEQIHQLSEENGEKDIQCQKLTECLKDSDLKMQTLYDQVDQLSKEKVEIENECRNLKECLKDSELKLQTLHKQIDQLSKESDEKANECQQLTECLQLKLLSANATIDEYSEKLSSMNRSSAEKECKLHTLNECLSKELSDAIKEKVSQEQKLITDAEKLLQLENELVLLGKEKKLLESELALFRTKNTEIIDIENKTSAKNKSLESEISYLTDQLNKTKNDFEEERSRLKRECESEILKASQENKDSLSELNALRVEHQNLTTKHCDNQAEIESLKLEVELLKKQMHDQESRAVYIETDLKNRLAEVELLKKNCEMLGNEKATMQKEKEMLSEQVDELTEKWKLLQDMEHREGNRLKTQVALLGDENTLLAEENKKLSENIAVLNGEIAKLMEKLDAAMCEQKSSRIIITENSSAIDKLQGVVEVLEADKILLNSSLSELVKTNIELRDILNLLKQETMESLKKLTVLNSELSDAIQPVASAIETKDISKENIPEVFNIVCSCYESLWNSSKNDFESYEKLKKEYQDLSNSYDSLVQDYSQLQRQISQDLTLEVNLQELQEENVKLFQTKNDLENELMSMKADKQDLLADQENQKAVLEEEKYSHEQNLADLHKLLETVSQAKDELENELVRQRSEFEKCLSMARSDSLTKLVMSESEKQRIIEQMSEAENHVAGLRDRLRSSQEEKELLQLRIMHLTRECQMHEKHAIDMEEQISLQRSQIHESMQEHKETIRLLVELRMEQQLNRFEQKGDFSRLEEELLRLESHISSNAGTPYTMSLINAQDGQDGSSIKSLPLEASLRSVDNGKGKSSAEGIDLKVPCIVEDDFYKVLELKHFQLADEVLDLKETMRELRVAKERLEQENKWLRETAEKEQPQLQRSQSRASLYRHVPDMSSFMLKSSLSSEKISNFGSASSLISVDQRFSYDFPAEMVSLQEKLVMLQKSNQQLQEEKELFRDRLLKKQEEVIRHLEVLLDKKKKKKSLLKFGSSSSSETIATVTEITGQQMLLLQEERDELHRMLESQKLKDSTILELGEKVNQLEESLRKEKELHRVLNKQKEKLEIDLLHEQLNVEKQMREYSKLQEMVSKKDRIEQQLTAAAEMSNSSNCSTAAQTNQSPEGRLTINRQFILQEKKTNLIVEIRRRVSYRDVAIQSGESRIVKEIPRMSRQSYSAGRRVPPVERTVKLDCGCITELGTMKMHTGCRYHQAVEKLRRELKMQDMQRKNQGHR